MDFGKCISETASAEARSAWYEICDKHDKLENDWINYLRKNGFKAAHPNDGWVNREKTKYI